jgi:hypothetical protein
MTHYLPSPPSPESQPAQPATPERASEGDMADLRIFWGPEICRLEYLIHLLETGRVKDEFGSRGA